MQIVIDVDEWKYKSICEGVEASKRCGLATMNPIIDEAIYNGTPLPKGHGDLKDMENFLCMFDLTIEDPIYSGKDIERAIKSMRTIIPADTESEE